MSNLSFPICFLGGSGGGATLPISLTSGVSGILPIANGGTGVATLAASQAEVEAVTSNTVALTPLNTKWHPGVAKVFIKCNAAGAIQTSYNVTSISDDGTGLVTITVATDFSSADYCVMASVKRVAAGGTDLTVSAQTAGTFQLSYNLVSEGALDPDNWFAAAFGDQ